LSLAHKTPPRGLEVVRQDKLKARVPYGERGRTLACAFYRPARTPEKDKYGPFTVKEERSGIWCKRSKVNPGDRVQEDGYFADLAQLVECIVGIDEVMGSSPIVGSKKFARLAQFGRRRRTCNAEIIGGSNPSPGSVK